MKEELQNKFEVAKNTFFINNKTFTSQQSSSQPSLVIIKIKIINYNYNKLNKNQIENKVATKSVNLSIENSDDDSDIFEENIKTRVTRVKLGSRNNL